VHLTRDEYGKLRTAGKWEGVSIGFKGQKGGRKARLARSMNIVEEETEKNTDKEDENKMEKSMIAEIAEDCQRMDSDHFSKLLTEGKWKGKSIGSKSQKDGHKSPIAISVNIVDDKAKDNSDKQDVEKIGNTIVTEITKECGDIEKHQKTTHVFSV